MSVAVAVYNFGESEVGLLTDVLEHTKQHNGVACIEVFCNPRDKAGWCEYVVHMKYEDKRKTMLRCCQRAVGAKTEFYS